MTWCYSSLPYGKPKNLPGWITLVNLLLMLIPILAMSNTGAPSFTSTDSKDGLKQVSLRWLKDTIVSWDVITKPMSEIGHEFMIW